MLCVLYKCLSFLSSAYIGNIVNLTGHITSFYNFSFSNFLILDRLYFTSSLQNIFDCACCVKDIFFFFKNKNDKTSTLLQHWVSDCTLYDGGSGWVVLQIRRRRRGQQLINNPGDRLIAVPRTSSTRYPCTTPVPVYLVPCTPCTSYPVPCTVYSIPMYLPLYPVVPSYPWRKPILLPLDLDPLLSSLVGQRHRIIESIRQLPRHSGQ